MNPTITNLLCETGLANDPASIALIEQICWLDRFYREGCNCLDDRLELPAGVMGTGKEEGVCFAIDGPLVERLAQVRRHIERVQIEAETERKQRIEEKVDAFKQLTEVIGEAKKRADEANEN